MSDRDELRRRVEEYDKTIEKMNELRSKLWSDRRDVVDLVEREYREFMTIDWSRLRRSLAPTKERVYRKDKRLKDVEEIWNQTTEDVKDEIVYLVKKSQSKY
jgi:hypothetical protein